MCNGAVGVKVEQTQRGAGPCLSRRSCRRGQAPPLAVLSLAILYTKEPFDHSVPGSDERKEPSNKQKANPPPTTRRQQRCAPARLLKINRACFALRPVDRAEIPSRFLLKLSAKTK